MSIIDHPAHVFKHTVKSPLFPFFPKVGEKNTVKLGK